MFCPLVSTRFLFFFFQAEDGIRDTSVTGVQTCALPISHPRGAHPHPGFHPRGAWPHGARHLARGVSIRTPRRAPSTRCAAAFDGRTVMGFEPGASPDVIFSEPPRSAR